MKLSWSLAALATARVAQESSNNILEDERIWVPDYTEEITVDLSTTADGTYSWTVPTFADDNGYPRYKPNMYYRVYVTTPSELKVVNVAFSDFDVEEKGITGLCNNDAAMVFNGPGGNVELARYCGNEPVADVTGTRQDLTLVFKTNENSVVHRGFTATFTAVPLPENLLAWNKINNAFEDLKSEVFDGHEHMKEHLQTKKAIFIQRIFSRFVWMRDNSKPFYTDSNGNLQTTCEMQADVGNALDFNPPTTDFSDPCYALGNFIESIRSFHYAYVCQDDLYPAIYGTVAGETPEEARARRSKIPAKTKKMLYNQYLAFTDQKFHGMGCLL